MTDTRDQNRTGPAAILQKRSPSRIASRFRILVSAAAGILFLAFSVPNPLSIPAGALLVVLGEGLRVWASGHISKNDRVTSEGPYSLSRNPLYVGNFVIGLGLVVAAGRPLFLPVFALAFVLLYGGTIRYEEAFLTRKFGEEYEAYRRSVPRFLSFSVLGRYRPGGFSFRRVIEHREHRNWIVLVAVFAFLYWMSLRVAAFV